MLNLVKSEIYKLKRQKTTFILLAAVVLISAFSAFTEMNLLAAPDSLLNGKISLGTAFQDVFMLFIIAIFAGFYIGSDFSNRTIQAALSKGHTRLDIILSKALVYSVVSSFMMLLYPLTVCLIHTIKYGWGEPFSIASMVYLVRVILLGSVLNIGTAGIYVFLAFICRDIPKTICLCFAFPVVFSAVSSTIGKKVPIVGRIIDLSTLSQLKYIAGDSGDALVVPVILSALVTMAGALALSGYFFSKAEIK